MHVYFSGIGGVGIGPLALLALDAGYQVSGSDLISSEMVSYLRDRGARVQIGQDGSQIASEHLQKPIDWFVYSSALSSDHSEIKFVREQGIKKSKRDEFLNQIIKEKKLSLIAVSGTHGKTTTTGMIIWALKQLNVSQSYSIGTSMNFGPPAQYQTGSEFFIYECDEFDRNFLNFNPDRSLITNFDYDHPDTYPTRDEYKYAFQDFISQSDYTYLWESDAKVLNISNSSNVTILGQHDPGVSQITLVGEINRRNAWLAAQCINDMLPNIPLNKIIAELNQFPGTNRRFEKLADNLYSDYAHHPSEITATINMAKEIGKDVVVVLQPHQNIRQHEIMQSGGYKNCLDGAKKVYWLPTYLSREDPSLETIPDLDLINSAMNPDIESANMDDSLWSNIQSHLEVGQLVVCMSAGDLDHWLRSHVG